MNGEPSMEKKTGLKPWRWGSDRADFDSVRVAEVAESMDSRKPYFVSHYLPVFTGDIKESEYCHPEREVGAQEDPAPIYLTAL
jgi:hypothetical protein